MSLKGIRMAFASEIDEGQRFSAAKIKWFTGKDELVGRNPHDKYPTHFNPTHKLCLQTNTQPQAPPNDKAFWERLHLIPFLISFVNRDPQESHERRAILDLDRQVLKEAPGILAWLVAGCLLWQRRRPQPAERGHGGDGGIPAQRGSAGRLGATSAASGSLGQRTRDRCSIAALWIGITKTSGRTNRPAPGSASSSRRNSKRTNRRAASCTTASCLNVGESLRVRRYNSVIFME